MLITFQNFRLLGFCPLPCFKDGQGRHVDAIPKLSIVGLSDTRRDMLVYHIQAWTTYVWFEFP